MKSVCLLVPIALLAVVSIAAGQAASPPTKERVPAAPLMAGAPANMQWTITYAPKTPEKEPSTPDEIRARKMRVRYSPLVLSRRVLKGTGDQLVIYTTYEAGLKSEAWALSGYLYELPLREGESVRATPRGAGDFSEIYWVSPDNFRGTVEWKKRKAHLYETGAADPLVDAGAPAQSSGAKPAEDPHKVQHRRAYIDPETRLPIMVDSGSETMTYQFTKAPAEFPKMDPRIAPQRKLDAE